MKFSTLCSASLLAVTAFAFPASILNNKDISDEQLAQITEMVEKIKREVGEKRQLGAGIVKPGFDANAQRISTSGEHRYIAPGPDDIRGPCPGLNVLANHGYISRTGVASVLELTAASTEVFGMATDLSAFLSVYSGIVAGDITSVSIGGKPKSGGLLGGVTSSLGLLGEPQGLSASHNRFEADCSPTRADLYKTYVVGNCATSFLANLAIRSLTNFSGDVDSLDLSQFEELIAMPKGPNGYDLTVILPFRGSRFNNSIATNGRYFAGPFTHYAINTATYLFTYHFFRNHSAEFPDGYLSAETLMSFEGVTGEPGSFKWASGRERIPENWYRRAFGDEYGIPAFTLDAVRSLQKLPYMAVVGGNTGEPNTFTGVNIADLTGGVYNAKSLLEGNNCMCFAFQFLQFASPDILDGLLGNVLLAVRKLTTVLDPILAILGCPQAAKFDMGLLSSFPGSKM